MDAKQFDGFARRLAIGASRRRVLGLLLAGGLAGTLSLVERQEAEARCRPRSRKCNGICCSKGKFCRDPQTQECVSLSDTCEAGENYCATGANEAKCGAAGSDCLCLRTFDKKTRCGLAFGDCGECTRDSQCTTRFGPGAFCAKDTEGSGFCRSCGAEAIGFCAQPCLTP
jgi:hypothetical protein